MKKKKMEWLSGPELPKPVSRVRIGRAIQECPDCRFTLSTLDRERGTTKIMCPRCGEYSEDSSKQEKR